MIADDIQLSKSFWLREFLWSDSAARMGREIVPTESDINNLRRLCEELLQPIRDALGKPMAITSGLRPPWLNTLIGGAANSEHVDARAADFKVVGMTPYQVTMIISKMDLPWNQLIHEFGSWTHISIAPAAVPPKREIMTAARIDGKTHYLSGVVPT
jgi:zinc D-Ala-D-Ala carboxypeptidase